MSKLVKLLNKKAKSILSGNLIEFASPIQLSESEVVVSIDKEKDEYLPTPNLISIKPTTQINKNGAKLKKVIGYVAAQRAVENNQILHYNLHLIINSAMIDFTKKMGHLHLRKVIVEPDKEGNLIRELDYSAGFEIVFALIKE